MKTIITGDIHNEFRELNKLINKTRPELVICCGDFGYWPYIHNSEKFDEIKPQTAKILWIDGNHEDHWSLKLRKSDEIVPNVIYMPRGSTYELEDGRKILFMGGADSIDKRLRVLGRDWFPEEIITHQDFANLPAENIDIFITHTCPVELVDNLRVFYPEKPPEPSNYALTELWKMYNPKLWFFGHWHTQKEYFLNNTHFYALSAPKLGGRWWVWLPEEEGGESKEE